MSTTFNVIYAFVTLAPRDVTSGNLRYDSCRKNILSYDYKIGYWIYVPNKNVYYAVIRAHNAAPSKIVAKHMATLYIRSGCIRSTTLPILTPKLFETLPECKGEPGWDRSYFDLYRAYAAKAAHTKTQFYFEDWKQQMATIVENLDKIATAFGWSYDRSIYTVENVLADNQKLLEQYAMRDMGVWD